MTTVDEPAHGWLLTAPWWHWPRQAPTPPAATRPALQKYATPDVVNTFLADPQRRLVFDASADVTGAPRYGLVRFVATRADAAFRKLYLPTHHRSYLVAIEVHCDAPGLPCPQHTEVCEAGLVVRRRRVEVASPDRAAAQQRLRALTLARARHGAVLRRLEQAKQTRRPGLARLAALAEQYTRTEQTVHEQEENLRAWVLAVGAKRALEGWRPLGIRAATDSGTAGDAGPPVPEPLPERPGSAPELNPLPGFGRWMPVPELPDEVVEHAIPLYPLVPDPRARDHDGAGRAVFYGLVPTTSADLELLDPAEMARLHAMTPEKLAAVPAPERADRRPRFDEFSVYELRCFVRRHDPGCPRRPGERDCHGRLFWSEPSEPYRLAAPTDPRGTAHRPVTIAMPDLADLRAMAASGGFGGVRVATPPGSQLETPGAAGGDFQICVFAIPLITIIAMFLLRLFLPIVVFMFGLWFLLSLKLCIPPSVSMDADLQAALRLEPPAFEAAMVIDASIGGTMGVRLRNKLAEGGANATKNQAAAELYPDSLGAGNTLGDKLRGLSLADQYGVGRAMAAAVPLDGPNDDLRYERRVGRAEVLVP